MDAFPYLLFVKIGHEFIKSQILRLVCFSKLLHNLKYNRLKNDKIRDLSANFNCQLLQDNRIKTPPKCHFRGQLIITLQPLKAMETE